MKLLIIFLVLGAQFSAMAMGASRPLSNPLIPNICQINDHEMHFYATSRMQYYSSLDRSSCQYTSMTNSKSDQQIQLECQQAVSNRGLNLLGAWSCVCSRPMPHIVIGCDGIPNTRNFDQVFTLFYHLSESESEFNIAQCERISECLQRDLENPKEIAAAQFWYSKLNCKH